MGTLIGWPILRLKGVYFAMITLSMTEATRLAFLNGGSVTQGAAGILNIPRPPALSVAGMTLIPAFGGMNPDETDAAVAMVQGLRRRGLTIMLVEHDMRAVMRISDRIVVLNFGTKMAEGTPAQIQRNEAVIEAYLGGEDAEIGV